MDIDTYSDEEYIPNRSPEEPIYTSSAGGMFAGSRNFTIRGGTFNNTAITHHSVPVRPPDFRMISMGDIYLQQELTVNEKSRIIDRRLGRERRCVRRVYSAKIDGRNTDLTVAMYQGDGAQEDWQREVEVYMSLRHPNIVQMYGMASSGAMYATIFHGELIPFGQFLAAASPIMTVYAYLCYVTEWRRACDYVRQSPYVCKTSKLDLEMYSTLSIRRSDGRLCADFVRQPDGNNEGSNFFHNSYPREYHPPVNPSLDPASQEAAAIHSLTFEEYHYICVFTLSRHRSGSVPSSATISSGAVVVLPPNGQAKACAEMVSFPPETKFFSWDWHRGEERLNRVLVENDWTRFNTKDVCNDALTFTVNFHKFSAWLTQANYIFSRLRITSNLEDYVLVHRLKFQITIGSPREDTPPGYLFRCPTTNFQLGPSSFRWPDCPAYWSLDPSGVDRLSTEEATQLGFPSFQLTTQVCGYSWETSVYAGLRQFHQAKGFDPESQDIARHMGFPLFQLSEDTNPPFTHVDELSEDDKDCFDDSTDEESEGLEAGESSSDEEDGHCSFRDSTLEESGQIKAYSQPQNVSVPEIHQAELSKHGADSANSEGNLAPQIVGDRATGGGFIHRFFWGLQQALATENVDTGAISPYLV